MNSLPQGSSIKVAFDGGYQKIIVPQQSGGIIRIFLCLFLLFWLGGWATGWIEAARSLAKGGGPGDYFLIFWLCGWTVGGIFAIFFFYRLIRPSVPETFVLANPTVLHDTGVAPFHFSFGLKSQAVMWKQLFAKRNKREFTYEELKTLKLREYGEGNRLTIDKGSDRIELAMGATELEREWLYETLSAKYS